MNTIETIRAEIERRMVELAKDKYIDLHDTLCRTKELNLLLSFIDTLEEPEVLPGFENEPKGITGKDFVPVDWVETLEEYGIWKIVKVEEGCVWTIDKVR